MNNHSTIKDILSVTFSNFISLISSILNGFVIPIALGTLNYGYYKIFTLYASYTALCHFGFNDGILLSYGGKSYNSLNKYDFRSNSLFFILFQFVISIIIMSMALIAHSQFYKMLFILLGVNDFTQNLLGYYQNISQTVMRFNEYSIINIIQYVSLVISILSILVYCKLYNLHDISFIPYICIIIVINSALVLWYLFDYRSITFGPHIPIIKKISSFKDYFISGSYMTFGYGISVLIFNLDSQFVIKFFNTRTYSLYAFSYSMFSAGLTILGSAAVVLLPHLRRHSTKYIINKYSKNVSYISMLVYFAISGYFILRIIIYKFIYEYYNSLIYFRLLLPGMVITCCVSTVISNYYYALKHGRFYFFLSIVILLLSFILDLSAYLIFKDPRALSFSSTMSLLIWYLLSNHFIVNKYNIKSKKNIIYIIIMMILFWLLSGIDNLFIGLIFYMIVYLIISYLLFKCNVIQLFKRIINII